MIGPTIRPGVGIARSGDRRIAFGGLVAAAALVALAGGSLVFPPAVRLGAWVPAHLLLAGAATTAIAAILPFFTAALVVAPPAHPAIRIGGIGLVANGALAVVFVVVRAGDDGGPALLAGGAFLVGIALVAVATFLPIRGALGPRRPLFLRAYAVALACVAAGAALATGLLAGDGAVGPSWASLKPAHAWLNLVGFAGLVIVTTLLHLAPTIVGTRLRPRVSGRLAVIGTALGAPLVAAGYAWELDVVVRAGALAVLGGAAGVAAHGIAIHVDRDRGRWTTDAGWHRSTSLALLAGQGWLALGLAVAGARALDHGADPAGWSLTILVGPLVVGGVAQILVGGMTHLLPAIGPGDPIRHAAQRRILGHAAAARLAAVNAGAALVAVGLAPFGLVIGAAGIGVSLGLLGVAARPGPPARLGAYAESITGRG